MCLGDPAAIDALAEDILEAARLVTMTDEERAVQRLSFVYGNLKIDNDSITREAVDEVARRFEPVE